ncbi:hypothetical protein [Pedobacter frigidisoli]|uniref:hypothetical protein n=1 Tax=Pedobacter frigidisoli TaxID=2530455 RepID=UPI0029304656|nr:hypothetical protein [Pedobacter frigidisoli]
MIQKLISQKVRIANFIIIILFLILQSCRKDRVYNDLNLENNQLIKYEIIDKWINENPVAKHIQLDWKKAKQTTILGKKVVSVPAMKLLTNHTGSIKPFSNDDQVKIKFYADHPAKMYFVLSQDNNKLNSFLLGFVPQSFSNNSVDQKQLTGKLIEYNFIGDTIAVIEYQKSKLINKYLLRQSPPSNSEYTNYLKLNKLESLGGLKDKEISNIFGWLIDKIEALVGWVGTMFNASYWAPSHVIGGVDYGPGYRLTSINWSNIFSSDNSQTIDYIDSNPGYTSSGEALYDLFLGYSNMSPETSYPFGPDALIQNFVADYVVDKFQLDYNDRIFLYQYPTIAESFRKYGESIPVGQEEIEFIQWSLKYLEYYPDTFQNFEAIFLGDPKSLILENANSFEIQGNSLVSAVMT